MSSGGIPKGEVGTYPGGVLKRPPDAFTGVLEENKYGGTEHPPVPAYTVLSGGGCAPTPIVAEPAALLVAAADDSGWD